MCVSESQDTLVNKMVLALALGIHLTVCDWIWIVTCTNTRSVSLPETLHTSWVQKDRAAVLHTISVKAKHDTNWKEGSDD